MVSTHVYQGLYEDYCTTYGSCDFMMTWNWLYLRFFGHLKVRKIWFLVTLGFYMVSTLVYQSLHGDYCATYGSCDFMVTLNITIFKMLWSHENQKIGFFDTLTPSCCNPCLLKLVYSLWYDKLVMYHLWWPKTGHTEDCFGHLKVEKIWVW